MTTPNFSVAVGGGSNPRISVSVKETGTSNNAQNLPVFNNQFAIIDSVNSTSIVAAAAANSVKTAYDAISNVAFRNTAQTITGSWTFNTNIYPSSNAVLLGASEQRWAVFANTINASGDVVVTANLTAQQIVNTEIDGGEF
jgi:hypothetical protein